MPAHDWTRVDAGVFHHFYNSWISALAARLNDGVLPADVYALAEQQAGKVGPDVLVLERTRDQPIESSEDSVSGGLAVATAPPILSVDRTTDLLAVYASKRRTIAIRHVTDDRIVALIEIASPGNKDRPASVEAFVDKAFAATRAGHHLVIVDLFPPRRHDPGGLCNVAFEAMGGEPFPLPPERQLAVAAFRVEQPGLVHCYAEPFGVGAPPLPDVPLFIDADHYVNVPMESTYQAAWLATPKRWRDVIEPPAA